MDSSSFSSSLLTLPSSRPLKSADSIFLACRIVDGDDDVRTNHGVLSSLTENDGMVTTKCVVGFFVVVVHG